MRALLQWLASRNVHWARDCFAAFSVAAGDRTNAALSPLMSLAIKFRQRLLTGWELALILLCAVVFRVYAADKVPFDEDQAGMLHLAHDAFSQALWPASSNISSTGILHGPASIYFLLLTVCFTGDPLAGTLTTALWSVIGVLVTYLFTRRYYGRVTASLAAALYAVTTGTVVYGRFIWQPNLMPTLSILLMFTLFLGAVERRKGWLAPAVALLALMYETHESGICMLLPVLVTLVLAGPRTIRRRDVLLAGCALCIILLPHLVWLYKTRFADVGTLLAAASQPATIDIQIFQVYRAFLSPYIQSPAVLLDKLPDHPQSLLSWQKPLMIPLRHLLLVIHTTTPILAFGGMLFLVWSLLRPSCGGPQCGVGRKGPGAWLAASYNDSLKRGFLLLIIWQGVLTLLLIRHTIFLYGHYTTFLLPGPFILITLLLNKVLRYLQMDRCRWRQFAHVAACTFISLTICTGIIGSLAFVVDSETGAFDASYSYPLYRYYTRYDAIKRAVDATEQLAQRERISHVYLMGNPGFQETFHYMAQQMHIPVTVVGGGLQNSSTCVVLPGPASGQTLYLVAPYTLLANELVQRYTEATLIQRFENTGESLSGSTDCMHPPLHLQENASRLMHYSSLSHGRNAFLLVTAGW